MGGHIKPLILHAHASGPNPVKIAIALEALNVPFTVKTWDFGDDPNKGVKGETFLKINENGRVPALEDPNTGVVSWESGACMNYVRRVYDNGNKIGPSGGTAQDLVDFEKWEYFLLTTLGPMMGQVNWFRHYHKQENKDALERYVAQAYRCYDVLEGQLQKSDGMSILPGRITAVDYHYEPWLRQHEFAGLSLEKYPMIHKWLSLMRTREEVQEAYIKIQNASKG
ncbi:Glutathione S-transferase domain-containing protein [Penicillium ucsense]|uniref:Glutathione S-transferase domain-containing protein n=1 Tax=Penicillium ucsense TaxID=2839758 RepID=A0A8J8WJ18_9EURO|nr:Glutathione S-transferase domain-containing protein [Penicillium ucsense]KAF7739212.1 Glutathione S-transferase domain-containing protein [Penicillium ucsense]